VRICFLVRLRRTDYFCFSYYNSGSGIRLLNVSLDTMCLAVPGKIVSILNDESLLRSGLVAFGQVEREVNLAFVPEAKEGMYVLVHAGIAISTVAYAEAMRTLSYLENLKEKVSS